MGSVSTDYRGTLESTRAQDRLARALVQIGEALAPALCAVFRPVDITLDWPVLVRVPGTETDFVEIGDVRVVGAELVLADFRRDRHRLPFTFIRDIGRNHLRLPDIRGTLVTVEDREECRFYTAPRIRSAQCFLAPYATQHLRYDLEGEFDLLMAYVRQFHMPNLHYWRYSPLPRFGEYRKWVGWLHGVPRARRTIADALQEWQRRAAWPAPTEWTKFRIEDSDRRELEERGSVEAIARGVLLDLLRCAHNEPFDA
ncbi:MAG: hypothetical protein HZA61_13810 [Candidatus Eisenbacteria bacterium]|uniref:Uncharacterized protein n=1 Tax=Eiseniibacteriota bacterium TaxID=2212470 RepID=A0A933SIK2_UNCEI|nr:hypothetical protein [Candidatus Eisenbacteria bacterium]